MKQLAIFACALFTAILLLAIPATAEYDVFLTEICKMRINLRVKHTYKLEGTPETEYEEDGSATVTGYASLMNGYGAWFPHMFQCKFTAGEVGAEERAPLQEGILLGPIKTFPPNL